MKAQYPYSLTNPMAMSMGPGVTTYLNETFHVCKDWDFWKEKIFSSCKLWDSAACFIAPTATHDAHIRFNNIPAYTLGTGSFTVEGWVWLENTPSGNERTIISKMHVNPGSGEIGGFRLFINSMGRLQFTVGDAPTTPSGPGFEASIISGSTIAYRQWKHIVAVRVGNNPNNWQLYVDGSLVMVTTMGGTLTNGSIERGSPDAIDIGAGFKRVTAMPGMAGSGGEGCTRAR